MLKARTETSSTDKQPRVITVAVEDDGFRMLGEGDIISTPPIKIDLPFIDVTCPVCITKSVALKRDLAKEGSVKCLICGHRYDPTDPAKEWTGEKCQNPHMLKNTT